MPESTTVDDLVVQHAAKLKEETSGPTPEKTEEKVDPPAGGSGNEGSGQPTKTEPTKTDPPVPNPMDDLLKEFNLESLDALKERLKPKQEEKVKSPEELAREANVYEASLQKYGVEEGKMKLEDFTTLKNLKGKDDQSLVFDNYLSGWKEDNPEVDPAEVERLAKADFETEYRLNDTNEKVKARGVSKIAKEAKEIRTPLEKAYNELKSEYDGVREIEANVPEFNKKFTGIIKEFIPEKFKVFTVKDGEEDVPIEVPLTDAERVEIFKAVAEPLLKGTGNYQLFKKGDFKALEAIAKEKTEALIKEKVREKAAQQIATEFFSRGGKKGSTTGAKEPFPLTKDSKDPIPAGTPTEKEKVLKSLQQK